MSKSKRTQRIYFGDSQLHFVNVDCKPNTDFIEFYIEQVYICKVNVNKLSKQARNVLKITTIPIIEDNIK